MIPVRAGELEGATLVAGDAGTAIEHLVSDSRRALPGSLFVCLRGDRVDGHDFVGDAVARGAVAVLCERGRGREWSGVAVLEADDPLAALGLLANRVRRRSRATVVGVAGAAGKTSTKDVLAALLAPVVPTVASPASFNNPLGVPLTFALLEPETRACVSELGTSGPGQLAALCRIAEPDAGVLTSVGPEHLEMLGSVEGAVAAEAELIEALSPGSPLVLPFGEPLLDGHHRDDLDEWTFGLDAGADVYPLRWEPGPFATEVSLRVSGETVTLTTNLALPHHRLNLAAAVAAYAALGLPLAALAAGAASIALSPCRGDEHRLVGGGLLLNDAYNANPVSMRAALAALADRGAGARRVAILGEMAELGVDARRWHREVGEEAAGAAIELLVAVGPLARGYLGGAAGRSAGRWFRDASAAAEALPELLRPGDAVLLKGSRSARLERLVEPVVAALTDAAECPGPPAAAAGGRRS